MFHEPRPTVELGETALADGAAGPFLGVGKGFMLPSHMHLEDLLRRGEEPTMVTEILSVPLGVGRGDGWEARSEIDHFPSSAVQKSGLEFSLPLKLSQPNAGPLSGFLDTRRKRTLGQFWPYAPIRRAAPTWGSPSLKGIRASTQSRAETRPSSPLGW